MLELFRQALLRFPRQFAAAIVRSMTLTVARPCCAGAFRGWQRRRGRETSVRAKPLYPGFGGVESGTRFYDPSLQRWINHDPQGESADANLLRFCGGDPINRVDPLGLMDEPPEIAAYIAQYAEQHDGQLPWLGWYDTHQQAIRYGWWDPDTVGNYGIINIFGVASPIQSYMPQSSPASSAAALSGDERGGIGIAVDLGAGIADSLSFDLTRYIRNRLSFFDGSVDTTSATYKVGEWTGIVGTTIASLGVGAAGTGGMAAVRLGQAGEASVRAAYNIGPKVAIKIAGRVRIADGLTSTVISEVKNVASLSYTQQLRDYVAYAIQNQLRFDLYVRPTTELSGPLAKEVANGTINLMFIP
jgi:RHS repeat-associated protein